MFSIPLKTQGGYPAPRKHAQKPASKNEFLDLFYIEQTKTDNEKLITCLKCCRKLQNIRRLGIFYKNTHRVYRKCYALAFCERDQSHDPVAKTRPEEACATSDKRLMQHWHAFQKFRGEFENKVCNEGCTEPWLQ